MNTALVLAGLALGIAASPHCAAMCGAPCAALTTGCRASAGGFHAGRLIGYMAGGALAAASMQALGAWGQAVVALKPLWMLVHLALLALGLWWLATGRPFAALQRRAAVPVRIVRAGRAAPDGTARAAAAGLAWIAWPCGASQAALLLAALADDAAGGAAVMAAFALGSLPALAAAPWLWGRLRARLRVRGDGVAALGYRIAGGALALSSAWAVGQGVWTRVAAWCAS